MEHWLFARIIVNTWGDFWLIQESVMVLSNLDTRGLVGGLIRVLTRKFFCVLQNLLLVHGRVIGGAKVNIWAWLVDRKVLRFDQSVFSLKQFRRVHAVYICRSISCYQSLYVFGQESGLFRHYGLRSQLFDFGLFLELAAMFCVSDCSLHVAVDIVVLVVLVQLDLETRVEKVVFSACYCNSGSSL